MKHKKLTPGTEQAHGTEADCRNREDVLRATVEKYLPEFVKAVGQTDVDVITVHQDAFAAGYHDDEYTLLGMAIKYAGLYGRSVMVVGRNHETF